MTLTNYWWLLIWVFLAGFFLENFVKKEPVRVNGKIEYRWSWGAALILVLPYIVWAGFRGNIADTRLYRIGFENASTDLMKIPMLFIGDKKDPGYEVLVILLKNIIGNNSDIFFFMIAAFQAICMMVVFRRYSTNYWMCIFIFIASTDYVSWMMNGMRQFIAVTAIFAGFKWMVEKKYISMIILILIISTIHQSALIMIPIIFIIQGKVWNKKTILMLFATLLMLSFVEQVTPILNDLLQNTQYDKAISDLNDDGTNPIRVLVYSVPAILSLVGLKYVREANNPIINISVNCAIVTMAIYLVSMVTSGIYIGRLPIYTTLQGYIAVPWLIDNIFDKKSAKLMKMTMILMFGLFFYYQMFIAWNYG